MRLIISVFTAIVIIAGATVGCQNLEETSDQEIALTTKASFDNPQFEKDLRGMIDELFRKESPGQIKLSVFKDNTYKIEFASVGTKLVQTRLKTGDEPIVLYNETFCDDEQLYKFVAEIIEELNGQEEGYDFVFLPLTNGCVRVICYFRPTIY